eukprot:TRINITY_DN26394_c0_g1_i1.p1 TRINITY_DN26394_c0_g1~~TRINITY_DN26394_c0_g1_i1.p1  ORF type:complete len:354 (-),score=91.82 TRINITY_DN26394_c0_g1_i1:276-1337(-)
MKEPCGKLIRGFIAFLAFGVHHIYFGRFFNALIGIYTLGGFGIGWAIDFFRLRDFANFYGMKKETMEIEKVYIRHRNRPPFSVHNFYYTLVACCISSWIATTMLSYTPGVLKYASEDTLTMLVSPLMIYLTAYCSSKYMEPHVTCDNSRFLFLISFGVSLFLHFDLENSPSAFLPALAAAVAAQYCTKYKQEYITALECDRMDDVADIILPKRHFLVRLFIQFLVVLPSVAFAFSMAIIPNIDWEAFENFKFESFSYEWNRASKEFFNGPDDRFSQACETLEMDFTECCDLKLVKKQYRRIAVKYHPDKVPASEFESAQEKFSEIAQSYSELKDLLENNADSISACGGSKKWF